MSLSVSLFNTNKYSVAQHFKLYKWADLQATAVCVCVCGGGTRFMLIVIILGSIKPSFSSFVRLEGN
jgi:hypothetical protein